MADKKPLDFRLPAGKASSFTSSIRLLRMAAMEAIRRRLLLRYRDAARLMTVDGPDSRAARGDESMSGESPLSTDDADPLEAALLALLRRQAKLLVLLADGPDGSAPRPDEPLLRQRVEDVASIAQSRFYAYRYDRVPPFWRELYADALILQTHHLILGCFARHQRLDGQTVDLVVETLDRALITAGGAASRLGPRWIQETLAMLEELCAAEADANDRPSKRAKGTATTFSSDEPFGRPSMSPTRLCPRHQGWSVARFEDYMMEAAQGPRPVIFTDLTGSWPALSDRPWAEPGYLLSRTFGGRRLVPVEVGRSYVDQDWGQELISFRSFLQTYIEQGSAAAESPRRAPVGYLAQHNLFRQIPSLRNDIQVPDFCWATVPPHPSDRSLDQPPVAVPLLNAWFGPARTITPLHTDGYHNLLCQLVGSKYVRLYPPHATPHMRPRGAELGVDMGNTSELDLGVVEGWDQPPPGLEAGRLDDMRQRLRGLEYWECILGPGDSLLIPIGWWHYVRSLSISFSVSFWWNSSPETAAKGVEPTESDPP